VLQHIVAATTVTLMNITAEGTSKKLVIPAKAGIRTARACEPRVMDSRLRGNDNILIFLAVPLDKKHNEYGRFQAKALEGAL
jgi:hypothetical protein